MQGCDFSQFLIDPFWLSSNKRILELPLTVGYTGVIKNNQNSIYNYIQNDYLKQLRIPGLFSKLHLLDKIRLSPEGHTFEEMKRLTRQLVVNDNKIFCLTYHSSSLLVGGSPYVQTANELKKFIQKLEDYIQFFFNELKGEAKDVESLRENLQKTYEEEKA